MSDPGKKSKKSKAKAKEKHTIDSFFEKSVPIPVGTGSESEDDVLSIKGIIPGPKINKHRLYGKGEKEKA